MLFEDGELMTLEQLHDISWLKLKPTSQPQACSCQNAPVASMKIRTCKQMLYDCSSDQTPSTDC